MGDDGGGMQGTTQVFCASCTGPLMRIRVCEERFVAPILSGEIKCPVHLYSGEEAVATGICAALAPRDYVMGFAPLARHYLAKGGDSGRRGYLCARYACAARCADAAVVP